MDSLCTSDGSSSPYNGHLLSSYFRQGVYFDQLSAEKSRKLFEDFIAKWNDNSLSSKYYEMDTVKPKTKERTGYTWAFVNKLDKKDKKGLQVMSADSDTAATHDMLGQGGVIQPAPKAVSKSGKRVLGPAAPDASTLQAYSAQLHKKDRRDHRKHDSLVASELSGGKATGFERKLEKKAEAKAERQARDGSPGIYVTLVLLRTHCPHTSALVYQSTYTKLHTLRHGITHMHARQCRYPSPHLQSSRPSGVGMGYRLAD
jgi:hypothetical protein